MYCAPVEVRGQDTFKELVLSFYPYMDFQG